MNIHKLITINAPRERVWDIIATQFGSVGDWVSPVHTSSASSGSPRVPGAPCPGRVCQTDMGPIKEDITEFDESRGVLAYTAEGEKMPFFVKGMLNRWALKPQGDGSTVVEMHMSAKLMPPFGLLMGPMMKRQMGKMAGFAIEELKHFAETGRVHERKSQALKKAAPKAA